MYCSNCGNQLRETDIFCSKCGHKQGNESKSKEPLREEVVFNTPSQNKKPISYTPRETLIDDSEKDEDLLFRAPREAHQSVKNARRPAEDDFVWNVHDFPETGPKETEDIDFHWDEEVSIDRKRPVEAAPPKNEAFVEDSKFHTYNKNREEFQELLDKEYLRQNRNEDYPTKREPKEYPTFDPVDHIRNMEKQREEIPIYSLEKDRFAEDQKFDTVELQKDLINPELDKNYKTQTIEKINHGEYPYINQVNEFDIKKTQLVQNDEINANSAVEPTHISLAKTSNAPSIPPIGARKNSDDYINLELSKSEETKLDEAASQTQEPPSQKQEAPSQTAEEANKMFAEKVLKEVEASTQETKADKGFDESIEKVIDVDSDVTLEGNAEQTAAPGVDERLNKLWDSDTAPVPVASLTLESIVDAKKTSGEDLASYDTMVDDYSDYDEKEVKKGSFLGKFIIAIIIIVLIVEGSILGLRNFAPESEATAKANQVILVLQNWIEDTFFDKK